MIAVDTNILVYAHRRESRHHEPATRILQEFAEGRVPWAIPWPCLYEFYSVVTNRRIWKDAASTADQAWRQIQAWTSSPSVSLLSETEESLEALEGFLLRPRVLGPVVHDARIAALCFVHGAEELLTADRDFSLFPELRTRNPLPPATASNV
ncbi:MAG: PIN domain-containing protein [Candidatus Eisenbacteria bacterium]|uniref:Ribonuclease VapC n=1 Tax=Eiseniibacteriota bacterium TaxID=2212470 RepID=A0A956NFV9_UNCEI|nr:PIN domain-containing protein [Candidatus Eisenbacteria bacterium]